MLEFRLSEKGPRKMKIYSFSLSLLLSHSGELE